MRPTFLPALFALAIVACDGAPLGPHAVLDVQLSASVDAIAVGETMELRAVATNVSSETLTIRTNACIFLVRIVDSSGASVTELPGACNDIGLTHEVDPGERLAQTIAFDGRYGSVRQHALDPGRTYRLSAAVGGGLGELFRSTPIDLRTMP